MPNNTIKIDGNQNIVVQDAGHATITINASDPASLEQFLKTATDELKQDLLKALEQQKGQTFTNVKNMVAGSIEAGGNVHIGDIYQLPKSKLPKALTHAIPILSETAIVGRQKDLQDLKDLLFDQRQVVLMNGLGGIGKTTLAQVYAGKYWDDYQHVAWITQLSDNILQDFATALTLSKNLDLSPELSNPQEIFAEIMRKLNGLEQGPNLLILDNADDSVEQLRHALPKQPLWHILITSRQELQGFTGKALDFLSHDDAVLLFKTHYTRPDLSDDQIADLVKTVDYHTLTIEILAKTAMVQRYEVETLKKAVRSDARANVKINRPDTKKIERITSFLVSIFKLSKLEENELWLLNQFVCLPPEFHFYSLLDELIHPTASGKTEVFAETLEALAQKGWLLKTPETDAYKMHRILGEVVNRQALVSVQDVAALISKITDKLHIDQTKDNPVEKFPWQPFGDAILEAFHDSQGMGATEIMELQDRLGWVYKEMGNYQKSKQLRNSALQTSLQHYGEDHETTARLQSNLALVLRQLGNYAEAKNLLEKSTQFIEKNFGAEHPETAIRYSNLALVLQNLGDYAEAKILLEKALHSAEQNFGAGHPTTATRYSNLATVLRDLGDYAGAKILLEKVMRSDEQNFGTDHPSTAVSYSNLAVVLKDLGDYAGAKILSEKAMHSDEQNYGADHPSTAQCYSNLALVLRQLGDYAGAKILLEKAMRSDEQNFGADHPSTAVSYNNLAWLYLDLEQPEKAVPLWEKAYATRAKYLGEDHPNTQNVAEALKKYKTT
ncbi:MAG: tetratricopeptide repeat protein [Saprospiraceae bacterium]